MCGKPTYVCQESNGFFMCNACSLEVTSSLFDIANYWEVAYIPKHTDQMLSTQVSKFECKRKISKSDREIVREIGRLYELYRNLKSKNETKVIKEILNKKSAKMANYQKLYRGVQKVLIRRDFSQNQIDEMFETDFALSILSPYKSETVSPNVATIRDVASYFITTHFVEKIIPNKKLVV